MQKLAGAKPIVVVSQCLGFAAVRYNGQMLQDDFVRALGKHVQFIQVCPEVGIGLGVPRDPIRIVADKSGRRLVQPSTEKDLTVAMQQFSGAFLSGAGPVDGFILKSRSPSCGIKDVKVFSATDGQPAAKTSGFFAEAVQNRFPHAAIEDEGRLTNFRLRHHFLIRLFAVARLRLIGSRGSMADLVQFQTEYKLQLMAYSQKGLRALGRIVANAKGQSVEAVFRAYEQELAMVLAHPARSGSIRNALQHAFGYISAGLQESERRYFLALLEDYREDRQPLSALLAVLGSWAIRFEQPYLNGQRLFEPYPKALWDPTDSAGGKSRD